MLKLDFLYFSFGCCLSPCYWAPLERVWLHLLCSLCWVIIVMDKTLLSLFSSRLKHSRYSRCLLMWRHLSLSAIFKAPAHSNNSMSDLYWEAQDWTQHFKRVTSEQQGRMISSNPTQCINPVRYHLRTSESALYSILTFTSPSAFTLLKLLNINLLITCLIFSRSWSGEANELILKLFLNMAIRVFASLRWILGSLALSWVCLFFNSSIRRWLYLCICSVSWNVNHMEMLHVNCDVTQCASLFINKSPVWNSPQCGIGLPLSAETTPSPEVTVGRRGFFQRALDLAQPKESSLINVNTHLFYQLLLNSCNVFYKACYSKGETHFCVTKLLGKSCRGEVCCKSWGKQ